MGGSFRKFFYYDEVDEIFGCCDVVIFYYVVEVGISGESVNEISIVEFNDINGENSILFSFSV